MNKIIKIDDKARIEITSRNYILQYWKFAKSKKKGEEGKFKWITDGYFSNMVSCATEYILNAPAVSCETTDDLNGVIKAIKEAEKKITKILKNKKQK